MWNKLKRDRRKQKNAEKKKITDFKLPKIDNKCKADMGFLIKAHGAWSIRSTNSDKNQPSTTSFSLRSRMSKKTAKNRHTYHGEYLILSWWFWWQKNIKQWQKIPRSEHCLLSNDGIAKANWRKTGRTREEKQKKKKKKKIHEIFEWRA